jgi:hypothetical protein
MIILSGPYLSPHFVKTLASNGWPLVDAGGAARFLEHLPVDVSDTRTAAEAIRNGRYERLLTSGEHALGWVAENLAGTGSASAAQLFKDKAAFRRLLKPLYPEISFHELSLGELETYVPPQDMYPFVVKPVVGFFSIGVHAVRSGDEWDQVKLKIAAEVSESGRYFPGHMLSQTRFILESFIEGDEFAVDAYYDGEGEPVVLNVMEHRYASPEDVSDRLYVSSRRIIETVGPAAADFLAEINSRSGFRNFPLHAEFRRTPDGKLVPIEINPLRFGGWCTTGDFAHYAWGFNSYELYMSGSSPDWNSVFHGREDRVYGLVVLDNSTGTPGKEIRSFDYDGLLKRFSRPLHLSRMDIAEFPLFGFLFAEVPAHRLEELSWVLHSDLGEFVERA